MIEYLNLLDSYKYLDESAYNSDQCCKWSVTEVA